MAAFTKAGGFVEHLAEKTHNLGSDAITVALSNTAPGSETNNPTTLTANAILANVTQISYTGLSSRVVTITSSSQTSGTYTLVPVDLVLTASGAIPAFRYVYVYNDTATTPADAIIGLYDYGSSVTLALGETFTIDWTAEMLSLV